MKQDRIFRVISHEEGENNSEVAVKMEPLDDDDDTYLSITFKNAIAQQFPVNSKVRVTLEVEPC